MFSEGAAPASKKCVSYHFDGTTEFKDGDVVTHRFTLESYMEMLMLMLAGEREKARILYEAARLKETD